MIRFLSLFLMGLALPLAAKVPAAPKAKTDMSFEHKVVEGQTEGAMYGVVEGNALHPDTGIVELRENFLDKLAEDAGEPIQ